jgi:hypothetical protein
MTKLVWIEVDDLDGAERLTEMLESNDVDAAITRTVRGKPEVRVQKPRFRRMRAFMADVESIVQRWLQERAPERESLRAWTADGSFEIRNSFAGSARARPRHATPA